MQKGLLSCFILICMFGGSELPAAAQTTQLCGKLDSIQVSGGEYIIMNNIWGTGTGVGEQCIDVEVNSTGFTVTRSTHNSSGVAAYPSIYKGYHHWDKTSAGSGMPVRITELASAPITWNISGTTAGGTWNCAYESWFSINGASNPANGAELMIWINYSGGAAPGGTQVGTVNLAGKTWDVFYADWDWNYIAYRNTTPANSITFDLKEFINDSIARGYINSAWYLDDLEAGFEIWSNGQGLRSVSFSGKVNRSGTTPQPTITPYPTVQAALGDVNNDRTITIVDALMTAQYYVGLNPANFNRSAADVNCDSSVNIVDALIIARFCVGLANGFC